MLLLSVLFFFFFGGGGGGGRGVGGRVVPRRCVTSLFLGRFPFNKNSGLKFRKFYVFNGTVHSGYTDPTQATARLVIVLASRIQKSGTGDNNFVKWKETFRSDRPK